MNVVTAVIESFAMMVVNHHKSQMIEILKRWDRNGALISTVTALELLSMIESDTNSLSDLVVNGIPALIGQKHGNVFLEAVEKHINAVIQEYEEVSHES